MSEAPILPRPRPLRSALIGGGLLLAVLGGAAGMRWWTATPTPQGRAPARPIVQIVRQQSGLPDLADLVERSCPAMALLVPAGAVLPVAEGAKATPAVRITDDGWLLAAASTIPAGNLEAVFGDGRRVAVGEVRTDPVSGLAIARTTDATGESLSFSDGAPPRAGQFGLAVATPAGLGCSADLAMIESDFLTDGGAPNGYFRLAPSAADWPPGLPVLGADGQMIGVVASAGAGGTAIPASIGRLVVDELLRNALSPTASFGFRAVDFGGALAGRLGDVRAGAGVALVAAGSSAAKAGLRAGDIVTTVDGRPVSSASELGRALDAVKATAELTIQRRDQQLTLTVTRVDAS
ncbi:MULTISPECIES: S1C family serine protease [Sphingomonas]|uniref:S1C family serine protease n=1 Tax=Sphingomonas TaxID=13687 RepID=UPI000DEEB6FB|nr:MULTISPECIES: S1C family serine protease [Sphingomonas]